jgi:hypothetical protein
MSVAEQIKIIYQEIFWSENSFVSFFFNNQIQNFRKIV